MGLKPPVTKAIIDKYTEDIAVDGSLIQKELGFVPQYDLRPLHNHIKPTILSFPRRRESSIINGFLDTGLRWHDE